MRFLITKVALLATSFVVPALAHADDFTIGAAGATLGFSLSGSPTNLIQVPGGFETSGVVYSSTTPGGTSYGTASLFFYSNGDFAFDDVTAGFYAFGANMGQGPMFRGTALRPTFKLGSYNLAYDIDFGLEQGNGTLSITPTPTPEPSSLLLMGAGLLGTCAAGRRRFLS